MYNKMSVSVALNLKINVIMFFFSFGNEECQMLLDYNITSNLNYNVFIVLSSDARLVVRGI